MLAPPPRSSIQSLPDDPKLRPPPNSQSSMIQDRRTYTRKRKCVPNNDLEVEQVPQSSTLNSTDMIESSVIRNSREKSYLSQQNVVKGKRSRKTKEK